MISPLVQKRGIQIGVCSQTPQQPGLCLGVQVSPSTTALPATPQKGQLSNITVTQRAVVSSRRMPGKSEASLSSRSLSRVLVSPQSAAAQVYLAEPVQVPSSSPRGNHRYVASTAADIRGPQSTQNGPRKNPIPAQYSARRGDIERVHSRVPASVTSRPVGATSIYPSSSSPQSTNNSSGQARVQTPAVSMHPAVVTTTRRVSAQPQKVVASGRRVLAKGQSQHDAKLIVPSKTSPWAQGGGDRKRLENLASLTKWPEHEHLQVTMSLVPPSPKNTLLQFLANITEGDEVPAMCRERLAIDISRYWEMRRVQNMVRRVLESLQDHLDLDARDHASEVGTTIWNRVFPGYYSVDEQIFIEGIEKKGAWPPEMQAADKYEVFAAFRLSCASVIRSVASGHTLARKLSRRIFCGGCSRIPYNLPDFPVPACLYGDSAEVDSRRVAWFIARAFSQDMSGYEKAKDYYLTGLLSLEQIQMALPDAVKDSLVERAVVRVINVGTSMFSVREWSEFVLALRLVPVEDEMPSLHEQAMAEEHKRWQHVPHSARGPNESTSAELPLPGDASSHRNEPRSRPSRPAAAMTEPLPHREIRAEEPICFQGQPTTHNAATSNVPRWLDEAHSGTSPPGWHEEAHSGTSSQPQLGDIGPQVISWGTSSVGRDENTDCGSATSLLGIGHQADEGAGRSSDMTAEIVQDYMEEPRLERPSEDPVRFLSMGMHNECLGPFLLHAFVRCCQLYEARCCDFPDN